MSNSSSADRFLRSRILYGDAAFEKISRAKIAICGVGAVGSFALESLARVGVSNFILVDFDLVEFSNINRQLCALESTVGKKKTEVMRSRILDINPSAKIEILDLFLDSATIPLLLSLSPNLIVDAIDSISSKSLLIESAVFAKIPIVSSMGAARRCDPSKIHVADLFETRNCPIASRLRKDLRNSCPSGVVSCVFSDEAVSPHSHQSSSSSDSRRVIGSTPIVTSSFGLYLASLAISKITENTPADIACGSGEEA